MIPLVLKMMNSFGKFRLTRMAVILCASLTTLIITNGYTLAQELPQEMFNRGNYYMEQEDFTGALEVYEDIEQKDFSSGPLFLNMGISYVYLDSLGLAKYYFLKASHYSPTKEKADEGIELIGERLNQRRGEMSRLSWISFSEWLQFELNKQSVIIYGLILLYFGFLFVALPWFYSSYQRTLKYSGYISACLGMMLILLAIIIDSRTEEYSRAVMVEVQSPMRPHPTDDNEVVSMVYEGYTFTLDQSRSQEYEGWKYIRLSNGLNGWIEENVIREL